MGNESSRPELPDGRSRSLSPLPRDDQLSPDSADDLPPPPSTMPTSFRVTDKGPGPPGARGSLAWHRRRKRSSRGLSPESTRATSSSPPPEDRIINGSQPTRPARVVSPEQVPRPATQPTSSTRKRGRETFSEKKRRELKEAAAAAHVIIDKREAEIEEFNKRMGRSVALSPFLRENADQPLDEFGFASDAEEAAPPQTLSAARLSNKSKRKGKEAIRDVIQEEAAAVTDDSIIDDDPPPSTLPQGKRGRRDSNSKSREKRKSRVSKGSLDDAMEVGATEEHLNQSTSIHADESVRPDDIAAANQENENGHSGTTTRLMPNKYQSDDSVSPEPSRASATDSHGSHSDRGYAKPGGQGPLVPKPGMGMDGTNGSPHSEDDHHSTTGDEASEEGDDRVIMQALLFRLSPPIQAAMQKKVVPPYRATGSRFRRLPARPSRVPVIAPRGRQSCPFSLASRKTTCKLLPNFHTRTPHPRPN
jgi:hypothetical protein